MTQDRPKWKPILSLMLVTFLLSGCASSMMNKAEPLNAPSETRALITFLRPSYFGGAIQFGLWDSDRFVGIISAGAYVQYYAEPGEHVFLARAENWSYVHAQLEGGKRYYILCKVFPGVWKARVAFDPIRRGDPNTGQEIAGWLKELEPQAVIPERVADYTKPRVDQVRAAVADFRAGNVKYEIMTPEDHR
jgi:hypothetical protein